MDMKCSKCKQTLDESAFHRDRTIARGRSYWCAECIGQRRRKGDTRDRRDAIPGKLKCYGCGEYLDVGLFYRDRSNRWHGRTSLCKNCSRLRHSEYQRKNRERHMEYRRRWKAKRAAGMAEKESARNALNGAVRYGHISRPTVCSECGSTGPVQGHHTNYSRPLDVEWLCSVCHGSRHRRQT